MVNSAVSVPFEDLFQNGPAQAQGQLTRSATDAFEKELLSVLERSMGKLGLRSSSIQVLDSGQQGGAAVQNLSPRRFLIEVTPSEEIRASTVPYVPFDMTIPASDTDGLNAMQTARNDAFQNWVSGVSARLEQMGYKPDITFEQTPCDQFVQPVIARIRLPEVDPNYEGALTLYHYDAWQDLDTASIVLAQANWPKEA